VDEVVISYHDAPVVGALLKTHPQSGASEQLPPGVIARAILLRNVGLPPQIPKTAGPFGTSGGKGNGTQSVSQLRDKFGDAGPDLFVNAGKVVCAAKFLDLTRPKGAYPSGNAAVRVLSKHQNVQISVGLIQSPRLLKGLVNASLQ
jgi:hypothetical protein